MPTVLLIDDEDGFRTALSERLAMRGFENLTLPDGADAVKTVRAHPEIDVVLLDRSMPGASGEQVLRDIKQFRPELQVIMLTGHGSLESAMETGRLDAYTYLEKPCNLGKVVETSRRRGETRRRCSRGTRSLRSSVGPSASGSSGRTTTVRASSSSGSPSSRRSSWRPPRHGCWVSSPPRRDRWSRTRRARASRAAPSRATLATAR